MSEGLGGLTVVLSVLLWISGLQILLRQSERALGFVFALLGQLIASTTLLGALPQVFFTASPAFLLLSCLYMGMLLAIFAIHVLPIGWQMHSFLLLRFDIMLWDNSSLVFYLMLGGVILFVTSCLGIFMPR